MFMGSLLATLAAQPGVLAPRSTRIFIAQPSAVARGMYSSQSSSRKWKILRSFLSSSLSVSMSVILRPQKRCSRGMSAATRTMRLRRFSLAALEDFEAIAAILVRREERPATKALLVSMDSTK